MKVDFITRSVAVMACATTLSLFTTIAAYAAVGVVAVKNDGAANAIASRTLPAKPVVIAKVAVRAL